MMSALAYSARCRQTPASGSILNDRAFNWRRPRFQGVTSAAFPVVSFQAAGGDKDHHGTRVVEILRLADIPHGAGIGGREAHSKE
jgi:hypothetical protein